MAEERGKSNDLVLVPGEYAYVQDNTKGGVEVFVGPHKAPLSESDRVVTYDVKTKRFTYAGGAEVKSLFATAPEGWYIVLKNPAIGDKHPPPGSRSATPDLRVGEKVIVPGPATFALWPGQMAIVRQGHALRSNQYILARVYNEKAAKENWSKAVVKPQTTPTTSKEGDEPLTATPQTGALETDATKVTMGQLLIIKGTDVAFYMPPTGVEVVWDGTSFDAKGQPQLVRDAVTLESLEYCMLLDQDGNKRFEQGPAVVFPEPTEIFIERYVKDADGNAVETVRKFRAIELNEHSGIYIKVIADYEENGIRYKQGQELFIKGDEQQIYFPREEHAIVRYGDQDVNYGTTIPDGEGRYVLNRDTGEIKIAKGPMVLLPDPRKEVFVRRILDEKLVAYLYPGNNEALSVNMALMLALRNTQVTRPGANAPQVGGAALDSAILTASMSNDPSGVSFASNAGGFAGASANLDVHRLASPVADTEQGRGVARKAGRAFAGDAILRKNNYTEPRTLTLNTKYAGPPMLDVWTGYAMMLVRKNGDRRVIVGPKTALLEYDETPQIMSLSTGKPKTTDKLEKTAYLCVTGNKVSDVVYVETNDMVGLNVKLSYRVNFVGDDPNKWFAVDNYVKFMCDHMRSRLRNAVMAFKIEHFYEHTIEILREVILGKQDPMTGDREGAFFEENEMHIYDVEVLGINFVEADVQKILLESQRGGIRERLELEAARRKLVHIESLEEVKRKTLDAQELTAQHMAEQTKAELTRNLLFQLQSFESDMQLAASKWKLDRGEQEHLAVVQTLADERQKRTKEIQLELEEKVIAHGILRLKAEVQAVVDKAGAIGPDLIAALQGFADKEMIERVSKSMAPLAIMGGDSVMDVVANLLAGTPLAKHLAGTPANGTAPRANSPVGAA